MDPITQALTSTLVQDSDIVVLSLVVWRESRGQSEECQRAVAYSILNRVARPSWWGNDVVSVCFKRLQYSSVTYPKDPQLTTWPARSDDPTWVAALMVAYNAIYELSNNPAPLADSYFDISVPLPKWATPDCFVKQIGRIRFYNVDHDHEAKP